MDQPGVLQGPQLPGVGCEVQVGNLLTFTCNGIEPLTQCQSKLLNLLMNSELHKKYFPQKYVGNNFEITRVNMTMPYELITVYNLCLFVV